MTIINSGVSAKSLDNLYSKIIVVETMKKPSKKIVKRGVGRPKKAPAPLTTQVVSTERVGIPAFIEPTEHDLNDELSRLDSFTYARYTN